MRQQTAEAALQAINRQLGVDYRLLSPFAAGENRATFAVSAGETALVLKLDYVGRLADHQRAAGVCDWLAARGYPAPRTLAAGVASGHAYTLRAQLPGVSMSPDDASQVSALIALNALQAGGAQAAGLPAGDWPAPAADPVLHGGQGYCLHETMRQSPETSRLLDDLQARARRGQGAVATTDDIVHFDFNPANLLVDAGRLTGVIDWEGVRAGDRAFDLATLLFYLYDAPGAAGLLWSELAALRPAPAVGAYLAHIVLRQVEWSLRLHEAALSRRYLDRAHRLLRDFDARWWG
jgi:aminoglycoside phosphotransferase